MLLVLFVLSTTRSLVAEASIGSSCQENAPCADGCPRGLHPHHRGFNGVANRVLPGHGFRNMTVASKVLCGRECLTDNRCFSFHYSDEVRRCELNGATASRFPLALTERTGTYYYEPEEQSVVRRLASGFTEYEGPPSLTDCTYYTQALASTECRRTDEHICLQWELHHAYKEGYRVSTPIGVWYAVPESHAVLTETGMTYHGPPLSVPSPAFCCSRPLSYRNPITTKGGYDLADRDGMIRDCSAQAAHLCTLAELKEASLRGYRSGSWLFFAVPNRDVQVPNGGCTFYHTGSECYEGLIPNTPRPASGGRAYCCPSREQ